MKLYSYQYKSNLHIGGEKEGKLVDLSPATGTNNMQQFIQQHETLMPKAIKSLDEATAFTSFSDVKIVTPIPQQVKILCSGLNYKSHIDEEPGAKFLDAPRYFAKLPNTVIGPDDPIIWLGEKFQVDFEVEFAVVFGKKASRLTEQNAMDHIFGYTILHDVGSRYIQFKDGNEVMGKNLDSFCPIGPCIVTKDEIPNPEKCRLTLKLNGTTMQNETNEDWCFSLPRLIEWLTMAITMEAGDILSTGTPAGIGFFRNPQVFLKPGDVCELTISGIGTLSNPVVADKYIFPLQKQEAVGLEK